MNSLKYLEYRGYDSAGIALLQEQLEVYKRAGKINHLNSYLPNNLSGEIGIGHTRWATHGEPSDSNSHPHLSEMREFVLVHNGIIENYLELKEKLPNYNFLSETDTEIVVALLEQEFKQTNNFLEAFQKTINQCKGSWAILAMHKTEKVILTAKKDSPLVFGLGENEIFLASDISAILNYTKTIGYLKDNQLGSFSANTYQIYDSSLNKINPEIEKINWDFEEAKKEGFEHFMLKEIYEQEKVLEKILQSYLTNNQISFPGLMQKEQFQKFNKIIFVACGTAYHSGLLGKYYFEELCNIQVDCLLASEARYKNLIVDKKTLAIAISQSGETEDTKKAFLKLKELGATTLAICNVRGSTIPRESDYVIYTLAGPEIAVASTKAYISQVIILYLLSVCYSNVEISFNEIKSLPEKIREVLREEEKIKGLAKRYLKKPSIMLLGRKFNYPTVLEAALKIKELAYIYAMGFAAGEMKHGPIALIENKFPVFAICDNSDIAAKMLSNLKEIAARNAEIITLQSKGLNTDNLEFQKIELPEVNEYLFPILTIIPFQLLAYYLSKFKGNDPDKPRNLAKSVTVE